MNARSVASAYPRFIAMLGGYAWANIQRRWSRVLGRPHLNPGAAKRVSGCCHPRLMRGSDLVDVALELAPRRWLRGVGAIVLLVMVATGTAGAVFQWYVLDKAAGIQEDLVQPIVDRMLRTIAVPTTAPSTPVGE